ncbi:MAG: alpha amylase C-terminal domain-containing protein, partial [Hyphomicrobiales bacterium]
GRREEFAAFGWEGELPDPQSEETFRSAKLKPDARLAPGPHRHLFEFYRRLIALRQEVGVLSTTDPVGLEVFRVDFRPIGGIRRWRGAEDVCIIFHAGAEQASARVPLRPGQWENVLDSAEVRWGGPGGTVAKTVYSEGEVPMDLPPYAFLVLSRQASEG